MKEKKLTTDDYMPDRVLDKIKMMIDINKFDDSKILICSDNNLPNEVPFKNNVILISCLLCKRW